MAGVKLANGTAASSELDINNSGEALVRLSDVEARGGFAALTCENDSGAVTGERYMRSGETSEDYRLRVGMDHTIFNHSFEGTTVASDRLNQSLSTMTVAQASGFLALNSGNATASGNYAIVLTRRSFPLFGAYPTYFEFWIREANETATNAVSEWGVGYAATTAAPTDGAFFRRLAGGGLRGVVNFAGTETEITITTTNIPDRDGTGSYSASNVNHYVVGFTNDEVEFWCNDTKLGDIKCPSTQPSPGASSAGPLFARVYNSGVASAGRRIELGFLNVSLGDMNATKPWSHIMAGQGGGSYQTQPGNAVGPTLSRASANFGWPASATALTVGTWTATSAPAANSLGGRWISPAISTLTSEADYPAYSYLNPAGTNAIPGKTLYITGVNLNRTIAAAAASTNGIMLCFALGIGGTASATNTADAATTVAPRIYPLDMCYFASTATVGTSVEGRSIQFGTPLVVPPGCYVQFIVRPVGTVTSNTLTVTGAIGFDGYFE